ncbi:von Willebrand factor A domain-containing protein 8 [Amphibalanus amphitrite]|uniref:von Willebrand factor A domain-containing protein 8 n=1 Tax=Amphibalanus amphitrite TaxID=1232801 RepID=A0A6A4WT96_AMPAM|nr:von Willebrand factor A domain-containing protein 8 [Amphibalanus amphitrite]
MVPDWEKEAVPEHVQKAAREMNRAAYQERLRQIRMSEHDAAMYDQMSGNIRKQVQSLRVLLSSLQAKGKERQWLKHQTSGELDDAKLIEGITGERTIYKRRGEQEPELGTPQEKPKRLKLVTDVSGSMYRFNGYDGRLDRMLEAALLVMEAFEGYEQKFRYDIVGHSGEDYRVEFVRSDGPPSDNKQRLQVLKFEPTPDGVAELWTIISQHSLGRSCREWPPGVANVEFESLLEELMAEGDALLATDGSVIREPLPRSGWGCFIRSAELTQSVSGATRLVLSSMRAETEAVTVGLNALNQLLPDCQHIVVATDSQSLLRKLEGGVSPPEWWTDRRITWLYCPGHAGVEVNEKADRLAGNGAPATSRIVLSASDFQQLLKFKMETDDARKPNPGEAEQFSVSADCHSKETMHAHSQFCLSGDRTVEATRHAISSIAAEESDEAFVIVLSDANLERYGIRPEEFRRVLTSNPDVNTSAIFLGSLGDQADRLSEQLPSGRSFVCLDLKKIPQILQQIFRSGMLS